MYLINKSLIYLNGANIYKFIFFSVPSIAQHGWKKKSIVRQSLLLHTNAISLIFH